MLTYDGYLRVSELTQLQVPRSDPPHHDEMLFIVIHQSYELWFKLILHEMEEAANHMRAGDVQKVIFCMRRINAVWRQCVNQIHILETMSPSSFLKFRSNLSPASGFQSTQFREIEFMLGLKDEAILEHFSDRSEAYVALRRCYDSPSLCDEFYGLLRQQGFILPEDQTDATQDDRSVWAEVRIIELARIYDNEDLHWLLHELAELFVDLDETVAFWRIHHLEVVRRMIGTKPGTGGTEGVGYLQTTLAKRAFPDLWALRTCLKNPC